MFVLKAWITKKDFDLGEAKDLQKFIGAEFLEDTARALIQKREVYAAEVYDEESGETIYHSEED